MSHFSKTGGNALGISSDDGPLICKSSSVHLEQHSAMPETPRNAEPHPSTRDNQPVEFCRRRCHHLQGRSDHPGQVCGTGQVQESPPPVHLPELCGIIPRRLWVIWRQEQGATVKGTRALRSRQGLCRSAARIFQVGAVVFNAGMSERTRHSSACSSAFPRATCLGY